MHKVKLTTIGTSTGIVIPKDVLARLNVEKGDYLHIVAAPGGILLTAYDEDVSKQIDAGRKAMAQYRDTLRELAK
jgi:putative addiction module antidote